MAFVLADRVRESSTTTGTGSIALGGAPNASYQAFSAVMSIGDTCWYCIALPGTAWETGVGTYTGASTLARTTVLASSNAGAAVSFTAGTKDVFICQPAIESKPFPTGTLMLFQQTAAPIYWTKQITHNDKALRVVSGTASFGGTNAFSTAFLSGGRTVDNHQLTMAESASHTHSDSAVRSGGAALSGGSAPSVPPNSNTGGTTGSAGSDGNHNHTYTIGVQYVDLIIASKD